MDDLNLPRGYSLVDVTPQREELSPPQGYTLSNRESDKYRNGVSPDAPWMQKTVPDGDYAENYDAVGDLKKTAGDMLTGKYKAPPKPSNKAESWDFGFGTRDQVYRNVVDNDPIVRYSPGAIVEDVIGGIYQGFWELAQKGAALTDVVVGSDLTGTLEENVPEYNPNSKFVSDTAGLIGGIGGGVKIANKVEKALGELPRLYRYMLKTAATTGAPVGTMDVDNPTMITGDDAAIAELFDGFDTNGDKAENVLAKAGNHLIDAFVAAGLVDAGTTAGSKTLKILNDYLIQPLRVGNVDNMTKSMVKDTLQNLSAVMSRSDPKKSAEAMNNIVESIKRGKRTDLLSEDAAIPRQTINRDTMSAIEVGTSDPHLAIRAKATRQGMEARNSAELRAKIEGHGEQAYQNLDNIKQAAGGDQAIQQAGENIQNKALAEYKTYTDTVDATRKKIDASEKGIQTLLKKDPTFGEQIKRATNAAGLDFHRLKTDAANSMTDVLDEASQVMTKKKNDLYDAIPNNAPIDLPSYNAAKAKADKFLSPEAKAELDGIFKPSTENFNEGMAMTNESGAPSGANFRALDEFASSTLADEISAAKSAGLFDKARELQNFKRHLQSEQLDMLANSSDAAMAGPAKAAKKYYTEEYAPIWRDGPLEDIQNTFRSKGKIKPNEARTESRETLSSQIMDNPDRPEYQDQLLKVLESPEGKKSSGKVVDYILGDVSREIVPKLNIAGKLTTDEIVGLTNKFAQFGGILKRVNPTEFKRFDDFFTELRDKNISTKELQAELKSLEAGLPEARRNIFNDDITKPFFRREMEPSKNIQEGFNQVFKSSDVMDDTERLLSTTDKKGVEAAFAQNLTDFTLNNKRAKTLSTEQQNQYKELLKAGEVIFKDRPYVAEMTDTLIKEAQRVSNKEGLKNPIFDLSTFRKEGSKAADLIITQIFGPLDRMGSRLRSATGRLLNTIDPSKDAELILDRLFANADEFEKIAAQVAKEEGKKLSPLHKKALKRMFSLPYLYAGGDDKESVKEQTEKALQR